MTHEYTILVGGLVLPGGDAPPASAIAWAADTILAIGDDAAVRAISRGDSRFVDLRGARVVPTEGALEVGGPAALRVLDTHARTLAVVREGVVVAGALPAGTAARTDHAP